VEPSALLQKILHSAAYQQFDLEEHEKCKNYFYGYQETDELALLRKQLHKPTHTPNLMYKYLKTVAGMEEQQRLDILVAADDDNEQDEAVAEALNKKMKEVTRLHDVNSVTAEAWLPQANAGISWVYFGRNTDVLGTPYTCEYVREPEIIFDRRSRKLDLSDCQYIARRKFLEENECIGMFPEHEKLIKRTFASINDWGPIAQADARYASVDIGEYSSHLIRDHERRQIAVFDVFYRKYEKREVIFYPDGRRMVYDSENHSHVKAKMVDGIPTKKVMVKAMRNAWFIGPYMISDEISPHPHDFFPYVLFRGDQEENTGAVFALGRSLIPPQEAYNSAHVQQHYLMEKVTVLIKKGALLGTQNENLEDVQLEAHMADGVIELNNLDDVEIRHHFEQIAHLSQLKQEAVFTMEAASGISNSLTGQLDQNKSGIAQAQQVEQATVTLSDLFANYYYGRMMLGRLILAHIVDDIGSSEETVTIKSETGDVVKEVRLNDKGDDGQMSNYVPMARTRVVLDEIESSRGYRAQNMLMLQNIAPNASDELKPYLTLAALKLSNLPQRHELVRDMQKMIGKGTSEEDQKAMDEAAAEQQKRMTDLEIAEREAVVALNHAKAEAELAKAAETRGEVRNPADIQQEAANDAEIEQRKRDKLSQVRQTLAKRTLG